MKEGTSRFGNLAGACRIATSYLGPVNQVSIDFEFESMAQYEQFLGAWFEDPETQEFNKKLDKTTRSGGRNEIWWLEK